MRTDNDICTSVPWFANANAISLLVAENDIVAYAGYGGCIGLYRYSYWCPQAEWAPPPADSLN